MTNVVKSRSKRVKSNRRLASYKFYVLYPVFRGGTILLLVWERRYHFVGYIREELGGVFSFKLC